MAFNKDATLKFRYKNYKGVTENREVLPMNIKYGSTKYHPEEQWLLEAIDIKKKVVRLFAMKDIIKFYK